MKLRFEGAGVAYDGRVALHPLDLMLDEKRIGVVGLNGSGKSTFARLVAGLSVPTRGKVSADGHDTVSDADRLCGLIGYIFQNPANQIIMPIVINDMEFGLQGRERNKERRAEICLETLNALGSGHLAQRRVHELSGGELQLAALASVLVVAPRLVIFDEPTNQLDLRNRRMVRETIEALDQQTIVISHDLPLVENYDRVLVFHEGSLVADDMPSAAIAHYLEIAG